MKIDKIRRDFEKWHYERHQHYPTMMETNEYSTRATRDYWRAWKAGAASAVNAEAPKWQKLDPQDANTFPPEDVSIIAIFSDGSAVDCYQHNSFFYGREHELLKTPDYWTYPPKEA